jgi:EAL domain-containing protein (putative c-di-GMP-specific phosphodiesterase class I)
VETCAINLSGPSLDDDGLLEFVKEQLQQHGIAPQKLCFEITETSAIGNLNNATADSVAARPGCRLPWTTSASACRR